MEEIMTMACEEIKKIYGAHPHIAKVCSTCNRWGSKYYNGGIIDCGMFRQTIIPNHHQFVIKTGLVQGGNRQCERELNFYNKARALGLEQYFAACYGKFHYGACTFYVFEYIEECGNMDEDNDFYDYVTDPKLVDFIDDNDINDLHGGNFAVTDNGVILTDYSGYWCEDEVGMKTVYPRRW